MSNPSSYRVEDHELLLDFYKKALWNRMVPHIPERITPNALTLSGQVCCLTAAGASAWAANGGPGWLYVLSAFLLLSYLTLDNLDGAHARRTGRSSPLGEFLDHGMDGLASAAVLVISGIVLQLHAELFAALAALASIGFTFLFWEQFRTGLLVIPRVSSTEGVTLLMIMQIVIAIAGEPTWLKFSIETITPGTVVVAAVLIGYVSAGIPPIRRAAKVGVKAWELLPLVFLIGAQVGFAALGSIEFIPVITAGLIGANVTCRLILIRHRGQSNPFIEWTMWTTVLPLIPALVAPDLWNVNGWAAIALAIVTLDYARNLIIGGADLNRRHLAKKAAAAV